MSADEIRRLAERAKELSQLPDDNFCVTTWDDENHYLVKEPTEDVRTALLAFAAMVERCEEMRKFSFYLEDGHTNIDHIIKPQIDYILKGATDEET